MFTGAPTWPIAKNGGFGVSANSIAAASRKSCGRIAVWSCVASVHVSSSAIRVPSWSARTVISSGRSPRHQSGIRCRFTGEPSRQGPASGCSGRRSTRRATMRKRRISARARCKSVFNLANEKPVISAISS